MKFMVMHKHDATTEAGQRPSPAFIEAMGELVGGLAQSGKLLDGDGLGATKTRSRVTFSGGQANVVHGPFTGGNELPTGFVKITVKSRQEAIVAATELAQALGADVEVEASRLQEAWDLGFGDKPADALERYLLIHKATPASEAGVKPSLDAVLESFRKQGILVGATPLTPSAQGKRLNWPAGTRTVLDGPFAESKELIGGYAVLELDSMQECLEFVEGYAKLMLTAVATLEIDVRPV